MRKKKKKPKKAGDEIAGDRIFPVMERVATEAEDTPLRTAALNAMGDLVRAGHTQFGEQVLHALATVLGDNDLDASIKLCASEVFGDVIMACDEAVIEEHLSWIFNAVFDAAKVLVSE